MPAPAVRWLFTGFVLDESTLELSRDGRLLPIERKPLEALLFMLQHSGEVVTKEELLAAVWPGRILSDTALAKCISRLREVLGDHNQTLVKTAHGYGYRFAGSPRTEVIARAAPPLLAELKAGDHPPLRPLWSLEERIGSGGMGDAWRVRHDKTGEVRIFKFARDPGRLTALKREITLYRLIRNTLEDEAPIVTLLDWNLEQPPYFIESRHADGGSLADWWNKVGGAAAVPMEERIELIARIADALAAVHSIGVLHKDLKPSNVLLELGADGKPSRVLLGDLGSGGLSDPARMEAMGITRMGFTKTLTSTQGGSGTPMYLAPEVLMGQPPTIQADIYALGVMLYQVVIGDLSKPMAPGWERGVSDEVLRDDIAISADGNADARLGDAAELARRLRALADRRSQRTAESERAAAADYAQRALERSKARRVGLATAIVALIAGLVVSTTLYFEARNAQARTEIAAARAKAVTEFLSKDVFSPVSSGAEPVKGLSVVELLRRAGEEIDSRFAAQPEIASELHYVVGRSLSQLFESPLAALHYKRALTLGQQLSGEGSQPAMRSAAEVILSDYAIGTLPTTMPTYEAVLRSGGQGLDPLNPALLNLRLQLGRGQFWLGDWERSAQSLQTLLKELPTSVEGAPELNGRAELYLGQTLTALWQIPQAQQHLRLAIEQLTATLSEKHKDVSEARAALGRALSYGGQYAEAKVQLDMALELAMHWAGPNTWTVGRPIWFTALMLIEQDQPAKAESILAESLAEDDAYEPIYKKAHEKEGAERDHSGPMRQSLGETYARLGKTDQAIAVLTRAVALVERAEGTAHPLTDSARLALAESLLTAGRDAEARQVLTAPAPISLAELPAQHPFVAQRWRVDGLLALRDCDAARARESLTKALAIQQALFGPEHWRTLRARQDLRAAQPKEP